MNTTTRETRKQGTKPVQAGDYGKHAAITAKSETATPKDTDGRKTLALWS